MFMQMLFGPPFRFKSRNFRHLCEGIMVRTVSRFIMVLDLDGRSVFILITACKTLSECITIFRRLDQFRYIRDL